MRRQLRHAVYQVFFVCAVTSGSAAALGAYPGWAVGENGTIIHTVDSGNTWTSQNSGVSRSLIAVAFTDALNGWTVGESTSGGVILHTTNGGNTWVGQTTGPANVFYDVTFIDALNGWAVGDAGTILHTTNGGSTWAPQTSGTSSTLRDVVFQGPSQGWAVGGTPSSAVILHTANGGNTWTTQSSSAVWPFLGLTFADALNGWAVTNHGDVLHTSNGGGSWNVQIAGAVQTIWFDIEFPQNAQEGWFVGAGLDGVGIVRHTTNGGGAWLAQPVSSGALLAVDFVDGLNGWAVGSGGSMVHTVNGGASWTQQFGGNTNSLFDVTFLAPEPGSLLFLALAAAAFPRRKGVRMNSLDIPAGYVRLWAWDGLHGSPSRELRITCSIGG